jgi:hypothetical protein
MHCRFWASSLFQLLAVVSPIRGCRITSLSLLGSAHLTFSDAVVLRAALEKP